MLRKIPPCAPPAPRARSHTLKWLLPVLLVAPSAAPDLTLHPEDGRGDEAHEEEEEEADGGCW